MTIMIPTIRKKSISENFTFRCLLFINGIIIKQSVIIDIGSISGRPILTKKSVTGLKIDLKISTLGFFKIFKTPILFFVQHLYNLLNREMYQYLHLSQF